MTSTKCTAIKRLMLIMRSSDQTEFIKRLKTPDHTIRNGRIFCQRDQIQMPMDAVLKEKVATQQQTLPVAENLPEGPLQNVIITCKQCELTFVFTKGAQWFFKGEKMTQPARCLECREWIREERAEATGRDGFQDSPSGPRFRTAMVAWAMREAWWTEAKKWDASTRNEATPISCRNSSGVPVDQIKIDGERIMVSSGIRKHPRIPQKTDNLRTRTNSEVGSSNLIGGKQKTKGSQPIIKLNAMAVAMVIGYVQEMEAANE